MATLFGYTNTGARYAPPRGRILLTTPFVATANMQATGATAYIEGNGGLAYLTLYELVSGVYYSPIANQIIAPGASAGWASCTFASGGVTLTKGKTYCLGLWAYTESPLVGVGIGAFGSGTTTQYWDTTWTQAPKGGSASNFSQYSTNDLSIYATGTILPDLPTVTTQAASTVAGTTATLNGNITDIGVGNCTARGFYVAEGSVTPTAADTVFSSSGSFGTGAYTEGATGLSLNTLYSAVAFATNADGTSTGSVVEFTTLDVPTVTTQAVSSIDKTQAVFNGNITDTGGINATVRGFYYLQASTGDPTSGDSVISSSGSHAAGAYTETPTGLTTGSDYRVAAFATSLIGTSVGATVGFTTLPLEPPTVTTQAVSGFDYDSAILNGTITDIGVANATTRGFYWKVGTTGDPTASDNVIDEDGDFGAESYALEVTGLTEETSYRIAAFATNSDGTSVGSTVGFTTTEKPAAAGGGGVGGLSFGIGRL